MAEAQNPNVVKSPLAKHESEATDSYAAQITVLLKGFTINYVVPSFPVFEAKLRLEVFDCFGRDCES